MKYRHENAKEGKRKLIKSVLTCFTGVLFFISCSILANGSGSSISNSSNLNNDNKSSYQITIKKNSHLIQAKMLPGSVRANVERIANMYGWKTVVWKSAEDYSWHGTAVVKGVSLSDVMGKILSDYPLQADFYQGNHVLVIQPRTLK